MDKNFFDQVRQLLQNKNFAKAIDLLEEKKSGDINLLVLLGKAYCQKGDYEKSLAIFAKLEREYPDQFSIFAEKGNVFLAQKEYEKAIFEYQKFLEREEKESVLYNLGLAYLKTGQKEKALQSFLRILNLNEKNLLALHQIAQLYYLNQEYDKAFSYYQKYLLLDEYDFEANFNFANLWILKNDYKKALKYYLRASMQKKDKDVLFNIATIYMYQELHQEAISYFKEVLDRDENHLESYVNLGAIYIKLQEFAKAASCYEKLTKLAPDNEEYAYLYTALKEGNNPFSKAPKSYVANLFDQYAAYYDEHMQILNSQIMKEAAQTLNEIREKDVSFAITLDLGCATGAFGKFLKCFSQKLIGVDLSPKMLEKAKQTNAYDDLLCGDISEVLPKIEASNLIVSLDVFPYFGDLSMLFPLIYQNLKNGGYFVFSIENASVKGDFHLNKTGRFAHRKKYITQLSRENNFCVKIAKNFVIRKNYDQDIWGTLFVLKKS